MLSAQHLFSQEVGDLHIFWEAVSQIKPCFSATIETPRATSVDERLCLLSPPVSPKTKVWKRRVCCSPPSSSNLPVGQYTLCPQPGDPPLEIALPLPRPSWFPEPKPFPQVPLTSSCQNSVLFQCPRPVIPHPKDLSTCGHKHGITPDHGRGGSAFRAKMGCPLHS